MKPIGKITIFSLLFFAFSLTVLIASSTSANLAQIINTQICQTIRSALSNISSVFAFSLFELAALFSPLIIFLILKYITSGKEGIKKRFFKVLSVFLVFPSLYILTLGIAHKSQPLFSEFYSGVTTENMLSAINVLIDGVNTESDFILTEPKFEDICNDVKRAYKKVSAKYGLNESILPSPKPLLSSRLISYTGALAIYSFPTGEININTKAPTYTIPFTVAHEIAHSQGVANEAEANFVAFLVANESDSSYIRYSAYLSVLEYMLYDLKKIDRAAYCDCYNTLSARAIQDISLWRKYSEKYNDSFIYRAFDSANATHLDAWDKNGSMSYSAVSIYVTNYLLSA